MKIKEVFPNNLCSVTKDKIFTLENCAIHNSEAVSRSLIYNRDAHRRLTTESVANL